MSDRRQRIQQPPWHLALDQWLATRTERERVVNPEKENPVTIPTPIAPWPHQLAQESASEADQQSPQSNPEPGAVESAQHPEKE